MFETRHIVFAGLVPLLLSALLAWLETRRRSDRERTLRWSPVVGIGAGYLAAYALALDWPALHPRQSVDWLAPAGVVLTAFALLDTWRPLHPAGRAVAVLIALAAMSYLLVRPLLSPDRDLATEGWLILVIGTLVGAIWWAGADTLATRSTARIVLGAWCLTAIAVALLLTLSGSQKLGLIGGSLAAGLTGVTLAAWSGPTLKLQRPLLMLVVLLLTGVLVAGQAWITPPPPMWQVELLFLAPLLPWVVELTPMQRWPPLRKAIVSLALTAIPLVIVLITAAMAFRRASAAENYPSY